MRRRSSITRLGPVGLACAALSCADPAFRERSEAAAEAIVNGTDSPASEDYVVQLFAEGLCSGTLIAPDVVLTAAHCVSEFNGAGRFSCNSDGELETSTPPDGEIGPTLDPAEIEIRVGAAPGDAEPAAYAVRVFGAGARTICQNDIAVVVLDRELPYPPIALRFGRPTQQGESVRLVGYGQTEMNEVRVRHARSAVRVTDVGAFGSYDEVGSAAPKTLVVGQGSCYGDSGGPAFSEETGAVIGVYSILKANGCTLPGVRNVYTQVAPFEETIRNALAYAEREAIVEVVEEPGGEGGAGGEGASAGAPNTGEGGAAADGGSGNQPGTGGSTGANGGNGATGSGATGSGATGSGATGGASMGEGGESAMGAQGGAAPVQGSGSRRDPSCTCDVTPAGKSAGAWGALGALLAVLTVWRRRRAA